MKKVYYYIILTGFFCLYFISTDLYLQDYHFILTVLFIFTFVGPRDKK